MLAELEVSDDNVSARLLDLPDLLVQYLLVFAPEVLTPRLGLGVVLVNGLGERAPDDDDVELRPGALGKVDRSLGRKLCVRGTIGGQQYSRGGDAQVPAFSQHASCSRVTTVTSNIKRMQGIGASEVTLHC